MAPPDGMLWEARGSAAPFPAVELFRAAGVTEELREVLRRVLARGLRWDEVEIVTPDAMWVVNPTDTPTATLFACHPPGSTRERIIVFADLQH